MLSLGRSAFTTKEIFSTCYQNKGIFSEPLRESSKVETRNKCQIIFSELLACLSIHCLNSHRHFFFNHFLEQKTFTSIVLTFFFFICLKALLHKLLTQPDFRIPIFESCHCCFVFFLNFHLLFAKVKSLIHSVMKQFLI